MAFGINPDMESLLKNEETGEVNSGQGTTDKTDVSTLENTDDKNDNPDDLDKNNNTTDPPAGGEGDGNKNTDPPAGDKTEVKITPVETTEDQVIEFLKSKGGNFEKLEELFQPKQVVENPYSSIIEDPEVKSFLDYKKDTGRGFADYQKLKENIDDVPVKDLALLAAKQELGDLSKEDLITYIEEVTGVDIDGIDDLTDFEIAKIKKFTKGYKENFLAEQEKYKTPLANENPNSPEVETITLEDGTKIEKKVYEDHQKLRQAYFEDMKVAVDSVAKTSLSVEFDNAGKKETLSFDYEYDADDKKNMVSLTADIDQTAAKLFRTEKGFDHQAFAKSVWRLDPKNWEKEVSAIVNKAIADTTLRLQQNDDNINFNRNLIPGNGGSSTTKDIFQESSGFGIKFKM